MFRYVNGEPVEMTAAEEAAFFAEQQQAPPATYRIYKTTVISRMSDEELTTFKGQMDAQPIRAQMMWADCVMLDSADPFFAQLQYAMTATWGAERANAILAAE